ncbi:MAG TPA: hypothetical protein VFD90_13465 [Gaiellales bacterium]|jgi:hypothetical protein|nr:hypothetical protein [Gaiellales bacterium]
MGARSGSRPFVVAAIVVGWLALGLALDQGGGIGRQRLIGAATWVLLLVLVSRQPRATQVQVATLVVLATLLEYSASPLLGLYTYRLHNVPAFVPPGHGLVYLAAVLVGGSAAVTRRPWIPLLALIVATAWAVGGLILPARPDTLGAVLFLSFAAFALRGRTPGVYAAAFALTAALELYGTRLGTWAWAPHDPSGLLSASNPPSGIPGGYCWLDFYALALAPPVYAVLVRVRGGIRRPRPAPAAPS